MNDSAFLTWVADRLVNVYGESENVDFVLKLRSLASAAIAPRGCTCHPSEAPQPCQQKYAFSECQAAASSFRDGLEAAVALHEKRARQLRETAKNVTTSREWRQACLEQARQHKEFAAAILAIEEPKP